MKNLITLLLFLAFVSCKKNDTKTTEPTPNPPVVAVRINHTYKFEMKNLCGEGVLEISAYDDERVYPRKTWELISKSKRDTSLLVSTDLKYLHYYFTSSSSGSGQDMNYCSSDFIINGVTTHTILLSATIDLYK